MIVANRAIPHLLQLGDVELFETLSEGLELIAKNALQLEAASRFLTGSEVEEGSSWACEHRHLSASRMLFYAAEEEAAKFLVLIDFLRCPKTLSNVRSRQLKYFYSHIAKGVYIELALHEYSTLYEIANDVQSITKEYYLDGDYEQYVFYNRILSKREENMYTNYKWYGDNNYCWEGPCPMSPTFYISTALDRMKAFYQIGLTTKASLEVLSDCWQQVNVSEQTSRDEISRHTNEMLQIMDEKKLLNECEIIYKYPFYNWFPLYNLDIKIEKSGDMQKQKELAEAAIMASESGAWGDDY